MEEPEIIKCATKVVLTGKHCPNTPVIEFITEFGKVYLCNACKDRESDIKHQHKTAARIKARLTKQ